MPRKNVKMHYWHEVNNLSLTVSDIIIYMTKESWCDLQGLVFICGFSKLIASSEDIHQMHCITNVLGCSPDSIVTVLLWQCDVTVLL